MKMQELNNLSREELIAKERSLKQELFKLNQQRFGARVDKPHMFFLVKRDIARVKTLLNKGKKEEKANG
ncbi:MAG: 50S ribosomal protein L29 [Candidatus Omnitrophica bacterium]|nr:50S ribosomal protein L29 [Candidatus Omnitrophota bacterium]